MTCVSSGRKKYSSSGTSNYSPSPECYRTYFELLDDFSFTSVYLTLQSPVYWGTGERNLSSLISLLVGSIYVDYVRKVEE